MTKTLWSNNSLFALEHTWCEISHSHTNYLFPISLSLRFSMKLHSKNDENFYYTVPTDELCPKSERQLPREKYRLLIYLDNHSSNHHTTKERPDRVPISTLFWHFLNGFQKYQLSRCDIRLILVILCLPTFRSLRNPFPLLSQKYTSSDLQEVDISLRTLLPKLESIKLID